MGRKKGLQLCCPLNGSTRENESQVLIGKRIDCLPSLFHLKVLLRFRHVILILFLLTLCHHIPNANSQPLLNQLAVLLRARPPWPTSFPTTASQQTNNQQQQQPQLMQQQHQSPSAIQQQISMQSNHVYPTSSEQLQNFMASNNLLNPQGPLSHGIPVVAVDPSQNSITIMTPTGPEQIMAPNPSGMGGGGGIFVAQPIQQNDNSAIHNNNTSGAPVTTASGNNGNNVQNTPINGNNNNSPQGTMVQVMPNTVTFDGQNLIDASMFSSSGGIPHLSPSGSGNFAMGSMQGNFPNEQHQFQPHQQQSFPAGFIVHSLTGQGSNVNNQPIFNSQQQVGAGGPPPPPRPPPIPKNLKGPAIIAVPKPVPTSQNPVLIPGPSYLGPLETNLQQLSNNPPSSNNNGGVASQPIIIHSFHQLPNLAPAFPQLLPQPPHQSYPHEHLISLPENAIVHMELNKTNTVHTIHNESPPQQQQQQAQFTSHFQPSQPEHQVQNQQQQQLELEKIQPLQPKKESFAALPHTELSSEVVGNPRNQRKRHQKQRQTTTQFHKQLQHYQQHTTRGIFRKKPTIRPTQIPLPSESESQQNDIDNRTPSLSDYSLSTIINMPSSTITGSFEYPDPPTPPNFESMNALKYPSPFEDSAEVAVKNSPKLWGSSSASSTSSRERKRIRDELQQQLKSSLHLHNSPFTEVKRRRVSPIPLPSSTTTTTGTHTPAVAEATSVYRSITTASAFPETSPFESDADIRETTTYPASTITTTTQIKSDKRKRKGKGKSSRSSKAFRPSPQIHSFEEPVTGIKSYITILPPVTTVSGSDESRSDETRTRQRGKKSLFAKFEAAESKHPPYEKGFKPVSHYTTYAVGKGSTIPAAGTTTESLYFDLIREVVSKAPGTAWSEPDHNALSESQRKNRNLVTSSDGLTSSVTPYSSSDGNTNNYRFTTLSSTSSTDSFAKAGWKVKDHLIGGDDGRRQLTTSASSETVEDWRFPDTPDGSKDASRIYFGNGKFGPPNCDKFHRFGFCPMNSGYPTDQVEKIASRCSALLSHLIAPLPKADVRYDVIVSKNGSMLKGRSAAPSGWSWKSFSGKPVCDTKEIKVVPGWAKNEQGEWLVILQTKAWKQEAQITLCTPQGTHYNCKGNKSSGSKNNKDCTPIKIKCVQRFTAQRLAVLDPENTDRCPVLRSVFLPSACVCLHDSSPSSRRSSSSSLGSSEEISVSSSNANIVKISSKSSKGKKGSNGKKGSKKASSSKRSKKASSTTGRNTRKSNANISPVLSSEEKENKSDMLDTAADSSTSGKKAAGLNEGATSETFQEREHHKDENAVDSPEDDDDNDVHGRPHSEKLISTPSTITTTGIDEDESEDGQHNQNEVDDEEENNIVDSSDENKDNPKKSSNSLKADAKSSTVPTDGDEDNDNGRLTTTVTSNSHSGSGAVGDETSASEEEHFDEKKMEES